MPDEPATPAVANPHVVVVHPFTAYRSSDEDGSPHLVVDGTVSDLTGWTAELGDGGEVVVRPFEKRNVARLSDGEVTVNPYLYQGEIVPAWVLNVEGRDVLAFIDPDGVRY